TASHEGLRPLGFALANLVLEVRAAEPAAEPALPVLRPRAVDRRRSGKEFQVTRRESDHVYYLVTGEKPERWVRQTDFANDEAVGYLADRLANLGVEDALLASGAVAGDEVVI